MTFKEEVFDLLYNNKQMVLKDLYEKYRDRPKGTVKAYYYEYHRANPSNNQLLTINELLTFLEQEIILRSNKGTAHRRECIKLYIEIINASGDDAEGKTIIEQFQQWKVDGK